jgi:hypothetical protein
VDIRPGLSAWGTCTWGICAVLARSVCRHDSRTFSRC